MSNSMTPDQRLAATLIHQPISVMASAGSGKTTTMVERYISLLKSGFAPRSILTVTFTKEAAAQLRERIVEKLILEKLEKEWQDSVLNSSTIGTLHSLCYSILNQYGSEIGFSPISQIVDDFELVSTFEKHYQDWLANLSSLSLDKLLDHFTHRELKALSQIIYKNRYLFFDCLQLAQDAGAKDIGAPVICLLGDTLRPFTEGLSTFFHKQGRYSFDDLEHITLRILKESTVARSRLAEEHQQILVDEFQDTSPIQWQILTLLLGDELKKLFIVGDPKQSIYGFRHAEPALFEEVARIMSSRNGTNIELIQNFRTAPNLLQDLNRVSGSLFSEQSISWKPMVSGLCASGGEGKTFRIQFFGPTEKLHRSDIYKQEIDSVCTHLTSLFDKGTPANSIAILFRNTDRLSDFSRAFSERGWAHRCQKTDSLSKQLSALELVSYLHFLLDPTRDGDLVTLLRSIYFNWSYDQVLTFTQKRKRMESGKYEPLIQLLKRDTPTDLHWVMELLESGEIEVNSLLETLFLKTGKFPENPVAFDVLLKPLSSPGLTLFDIPFFLKTFHESDYLFQESTLPHEDTGGIQLMTVHASKGLEFEEVILVDAVRQLPNEAQPLLLKAGLPPGIRFWEKEKKVLSGSYQSLLDEKKQKDLEESKRILYVAMTRARHSLTVFVPHESAISYPRNSWADLLMQAAVEERGSSSGFESAPPSVESEITT